MTPEQFARWKEFSCLLAHHGWPDATPARKQKIEGAVRAFLSWREDPARHATIVDWDSAPDYIGDAVSDALNQHYHERWLRGGRVEPRGNKFEGQVSACIRAGLDMASAPSAGVIGFTVGTLRRMYPGGIPEWVTADFNTPITPETPDDAGVWL